MGCRLVPPSVVPPENRCWSILRILRVGGHDSPAGALFGAGMDRMERNASRIVVLATALSVALAACAGSPEGGGSTSGPGATVGPAGTPAGGVPTSTAPAGSGVLDSFIDAGASAVVTIDGTRYEFTDLYCVTIAGAMGVQSIKGNPKVNIDLPPLGWETSGAGWDPPSVSVSSDEPSFTLVAGAETIGYIANLKAEDSRVDSYDTDGYCATGTATFIDANVALTQAAEPLKGTFEVTCPRP